MSCSATCFGIDAAAPLPAEGQKRCLTRVFADMKARWIAGEKLKSLTAFSCRYAPIESDDLAFLRELSDEQFSELESVILNCDVDDQTVERIAKIVEYCTKVEHLVIVSSKITLRSYVAVAEMLECNSSVREIALFNPSVPLKLDEVRPLFSYALTVNPERPENSRWAFNSPKSVLGFEYEKAKEEADVITRALIQREKFKKVRAAKIIAQMPTICMKTAAKKLRKRRATVGEYAMAMQYIE
jgi:hypothetical protein